MARRKGVSIRDVARESRASLTTVSLVLNKRDRRISHTTRERILQTVRRLGYRPSRLAQGFQAQKSNFLAIVVPQIRHAFADAYFGELISAIHDRANAAGYKVMLEVANDRYVNGREYLELFERDFIDGMLCLGVTDRDTYLRDFEKNPQPVVIVNNYLPDSSLNYVRLDYHQAGKLAGECLLRHGHRNVALIHGAREVRTTHDLRRGFEEALAAAGCALPAQRVEDGLYTEEGGLAAAKVLVSRDREITAILAGNDKMAIGAIRGLKEMGLRVPDDLSVIGCDDIHQAEFCDPPLTTVHTPIYDVGTRACEHLLELVDEKTAAVAETYPVSLTERQSVASLRCSGDRP